MGRSAKLRLLVLLAFRSLYSHKAKSLIVGALIFFGTILRRRGDLACSHR